LFFLHFSLGLSAHAGGLSGGGNEGGGGGAEGGADGGAPHKPQVFWHLFSLQSL
jgi:hypothetical protein